MRLPTPDVRQREVEVGGEQADERDRQDEDGALVPTRRRHTRVLNLW